MKYICNLSIFLIICEHNMLYNQLTSMDAQILPAYGLGKIYNKHLILYILSYADNFVQVMRFMFHTSNNLRNLVIKNLKIAINIFGIGEMNLNLKQIYMLYTRLLPDIGCKISPVDIKQLHPNMEYLILLEAGDKKIAIVQTF